MACRYSVVRPTGLIRDADPDDGKPYTLEFSQGDVIAGRLSRADVASVVATALQEPAALGATFEVRRTERWGVGGPAKFDAASAKVEFLKLVKGATASLHELRAVPPCWRGAQVAAEGGLTALCVDADSERRRVGLRPMPAWVPPPAPVPEERAKEILADPRVQEEQSRDKKVRARLLVDTGRSVSARMVDGG